MNEGGPAQRTATRLGPYCCTEGEPDGGKGYRLFWDPVAMAPQVKGKTRNGKQRSSHDRGTANRATIFR